MSEYKFLIIRLSAIGDVIHALPMAYLLRENFPNARIDWVVGDACRQLIEKNPLITNCYSVPLSKWKKNWLNKETIKEICDFNKMLQQNEYDIAFDAHGMFKSAVISAFCGAKKRIGYRDYREGAAFAANVLLKPRSKRPHIYYHVIKRHLDMVQDVLNITTNFPQATLPAVGPNDAKYITSLLPKGKPIVVLAPATTRQNKHWDVKNWQELYSMLISCGDVNVVFTGTTADLALINEITQGCETCTVLAGKTDLLQYIEVLRRADIVVSPDSSAAHIAFATQEKGFGPRIITIFCSTSKYTYAPLGAQNFAFPAAEPVCTPCQKKKCKYGHQKCTKQTTVYEVFEKISAML